MHELVSFFRELDAELKVIATQAFRIVIILLLAWVMQAVATRLIRVFRDYMARRTEGSEVNRIETLARVFRNAAAVVIVLVAGMLILDELGISVAPILATAGVAGIAIGFGAQSLIKDYFNGFFLLLDDQVRQGDVVEIAGKGGLVEEVTLRYVRLRDFDGHVHYVPNGEIKVVTNRTKGYATISVEVTVAHGQDPDTALGAMREVAAAMRAEPDWRSSMVEDIEIVGVQNWSETGLVLAARLKVVPPIQQWNVRREYLKRLKKAYEARGVEAGLPRLAIYPSKAE